MDSPDVPTGWNAIGEPVPDRRKSIALSHLREMNSNLSTEEEMSVVGRVAAAIEQDKPFEAMKQAGEVVDTTGAYRLFAVLCTSKTE